VLLLESNMHRHVALRVPLIALRSLTLLWPMTGPIVTAKTFSAVNESVTAGIGPVVLRRCAG
jgi:hypothetical protein